MFNVNDKIIGKANSGLQNANQYTMFNVTFVQEQTHTIDIELVAKFNGNHWKPCKVVSYYSLDDSLFEKAPDAAVMEAFPPKVSKAKIDESYNLGSGFKITKRVDGSIESNLNSTKKVAREVMSDRIEAIEKLIENYNKDKEGFSLMREISKDEFSAINGIFDKQAIKKGMADLIKFFVEFQYTPSLRFVNTLIRKLVSNRKDAIEYVNNYFALSTSPYKDSIAEKMKSMEFETILNTISVIEPGHKINDRVKIYYGAPGAGKTTQALKEADGRKIVCHAGMLPADIMEDFILDDGKAGFHKSVVCKCMEEGLPIVFDEINNLTGEALNFMQGVLDNTESIIYKDEIIHIKPGFQVIGTMNLIRNGSAFGLSEAIVDRCEDIQEFKMDADMLMHALD